MVDKPVVVDSGWDVRRPMVGGASGSLVWCSGGLAWLAKFLCRAGTYKDAKDRATLQVGGVGAAVGNAPGAVDWPPARPYPVEWQCYF